MGYNFRGKVALITGTASKRGMGFATAIRLARDGADVAVVDIHRQHPRFAEDDRIEDWKGLDSVVAGIESEGRQGLAIVADVSKSDQVEGMVSQTIEKFGKIDILVNGSAIQGPLRVPTLELDEDVWCEVLASNLIGPFLCSRAVAKTMIEGEQGGKIVNIASVVGKVAYAGIAPYSASKAGVINLTQTLALELAANKINVNAICPGGTATEIARGGPIRSEARRLGISIEEASAIVCADVIPQIPLGAVAQPENQADAIAFLASSEADHITGVALNVAGGMLMAP